MMRYRESGQRIIIILGTGEGWLAPMHHHSVENSSGKWELSSSVDQTFITCTHTAKQIIESL